MKQPIGIYIIGERVTKDHHQNLIEVIRGAENLSPLLGGGKQRLYGLFICMPICRFLLLNDYIETKTRFLLARWRE